MQLCSFPSIRLLACNMKNTQRWIHQGQSVGTKPPYETLMLSLSFSDKDLQPVRANCQKLLAFTSEFLGLVYVCEPRDWLVCGARPRTNRLWHRLRGAQLQSHLLLHVCVRACAHVHACLLQRGLDSVFAARYITLRVKGVKEMTNRQHVVINSLAANEPLSVFFLSLHCGFYLPRSARRTLEGKIAVDPWTFPFPGHMKQLSGLGSRRPKSCNQVV